MPIWSWIVNVILWIISTCLVGLSIWYIYKAVRILNRAKWSEYADQFKGYLDTAERQRNDWMGVIERHKKLIKGYETLEDTKEVAELYKELEELYNSFKEHYDHEVNILASLRQFTEKGGVAGFSAIQQIEATKNIAVAAVCLAISSVGFSVSSIIISIAG